MQRQCNKCGRSHLVSINIPPHICKEDSLADKAVKFDNGKPDLSLIRREAIEPIATVFQFGAAKYGRSNYLQGGMSHNRLLAAAARHLYAYASGEDLDRESGLSHLAHLGCCVHMLLTYKELGLGTDDRDIKLDNSK